MGKRSNREWPGCEIMFWVFQCRDRATSDPLYGVNDPLKCFSLGHCTDSVPDAHAFDGGSEERHQQFLCDVPPK